MMLCIDKITCVKMYELISRLWKSRIKQLTKELEQRGDSLDDIKTQTEFGRNAAIVKAKEAANTNDETHKRFEIMCRMVFKKFKACITDPRVNTYRPDRDAIHVISKQQER